MDISNTDKGYVGMDTSMLMEMAHSKHATQQQKNAAVSQQFEAVLVKQFLKEALKPMIKGVFSDDGNANRMYRHFFTDAIVKLSFLDSLIKYLSEKYRFI